MALHLIQAQVQLGELYHWAGSRHLMPRIFDEGYALHCLLNSSFGEKQFQPFRLLYPRDAKVATLYGYSQANADELTEMAMTFAEPSFARIVTGKLQGKLMPDNFSKVRRLGFDIKVRPTTRGKAGEQDAFLHAAIQSPDQLLSRELVYRDWVLNRLQKNGATMKQESPFTIASYRRTRAIRQAGQRSGSEGPEVVVHGELQITDPDAFDQLLSRGLGRHKAYGYGMLLLRPPSRH